MSSIEEIIKNVDTPNIEVSAHKEILKSAYMRAGTKSTPVKKSGSSLMRLASLGLPIITLGFISLAVLSINDKNNDVDVAARMEAETSNGQGVDSEQDVDIEDEIKEMEVNDQVTTEDIEKKENVESSEEQEVDDTRQEQVSVDGENRLFVGDTSWELLNADHYDDHSDITYSKGAATVDIKLFTVVESRQFSADLEWRINYTHDQNNYVSVNLVSSEEELCEAPESEESNAGFCTNGNNILDIFVTDKNTEGDYEPYHYSMQMTYANTDWDDSPEAFEEFRQLIESMKVSIIPGL